MRAVRSGVSGGSFSGPAPRFAWALALGGMACGNSTASPVPPVVFEGTLPASVAARAIANTLTVEASIGGSASRPILVDTGSPMTGVDPSSWPDAALPAEVSLLPALGVGALTFVEVPSVTLTECGAGCGPYDVTGVLGGNVLRSFVVGFDYQAPAVSFGPGAVPADAMPPATVVPFDVAGGGTGTIAGGDGQVVDVPPTRLVLQASIEGTARTLIVDTGSSYTLLRQSLFTALVSDGRAQLTLGVSTAAGAAQGAVARTRSLDVGGATSTGSVVGSMADDEVDNLASETGRTLDGVLGGAFLRAFYALVDYGAGQLSLYPYVAVDPLADEFDRAGIFLGEDGGGYVVAQAVEPDEQSLVGAVVVDVDGTAVAGLDPEQADRLLRGSPGTTHTLHLQQGGAVEAETLPVVDVLPLSP